MAVLQGILHFNLGNNKYMLFCFNNTCPAEFRCINLKTSIQMDLYFPLI